MTPMWVILDLKYSLRLRAMEQNDPYVGHFVPSYACGWINKDKMTIQNDPMWVILEGKYMLMYFQQAVSNRQNDPLWVILEGNYL